MLPLTVDQTSSSEALTVVGPNRMASLPDDIIFLIFTRIITIRDFAVFSETCRHMCQISHTIPVYAFTRSSLPYQHIYGFLGTTIHMPGITNRSLAEFVLIRDIEFKKAATQLICAADNKNNPSPLELSNAENEFYAVFKRSCFKINTKTNCKDFSFCMFISARCINKIYSEYDIPSTPQQKMLLNVSMESVASKLQEKAYNELVDMITDQLTESVTFDSFKYSAECLKALFSGKSPIDIEASLRRALRLKYETAFQIFAPECLNAFPKSKIVAEMTQQLKTPLEARKAAIEAELALLRGPSCFNGTINDAYIEMDALTHMQDEPVDRARLEVATVEFLNAYRSTFPGYDSYTSIEELLSFNFMFCPYALKDAFIDYHASQESPTVHKRIAAKSKFASLLARLSTLAQWEDNSDTLIGGELFEVCKKLENIDFMALIKVRQQGKFYTHLLCPVTDENKEELYNSLLELPNP